jgi:hypothetical protein
LPTLLQSTDGVFAPDRDHVVLVVDELVVLLRVGQVVVAGEVGGIDVDLLLCGTV